MLDATTFACPSCTAPLRATSSAPSVVCPYCDSTVAVPLALRRTPPPPPPYMAPLPAGLAPGPPSGLARSALILSIVGLVINCMLTGPGAILSIIALVLTSAYDAQRKTALTPPHPNDARNIRIARILGVISLILTLAVCGFLLLVATFGAFGDTGLTPTVVP